MNEHNIDPQHDSAWDEAYTRGFADKLYEEETWVPAAPVPPAPQKPKRKRKILKFFLVLFSICIVIFAAHQLLVRAPAGEKGDRKSGCATILLAGTDASGDRTDTIMLLSIDRKEKQISLLSIPRDTKVNSTYTPHKINLAYGVNGKGESGMDSLMDYVADCVGFRPDGYILVDLDVFISLVDLLGGVEFEVPCAMYYEDASQNLTIRLEPGKQKLDGYAAMGVVRFRSGYAMADLQRVSVQRDFMMSALKQWATLSNVFKLPKAVDLLKENSVTDLSTGNLIWLAESAAICGTSNMEMMTVPYFLDETYVYIDADDEYADLINRLFNPYKTQITTSDLDPA